MNVFSEDALVEASVISIIKEMWGAGFRHINGYTPEGDSQLNRSHQGEVVLTSELIPALRKINPGVSDDLIIEAVDYLTREQPEGSLANINRDIYFLLKDGYKTTYMDPNGVTVDLTVKFFDFAETKNNSFLCVSQMWIVGELYKRRPDIIIFVNGIPIYLFELKASHVKLVNAFTENIRDYKDTIPKLFWYNMGIILSNGMESKFGSLTSPYEFFNEWKKVDDESEETSTSLRTFLFGLCMHNRILDIFENFVLFNQSDNATKKILPRYFQYLGVNRAFKNVIRRKSLLGKLGVFWHTQGSGKSFSMVFLSQKVLRKIEGNFTFIIVTDRKDLDRQAYKNFASVGAVYESEVHADSIHNLKELLLSDHRQIFTTIQKFQDINKQPYFESCFPIQNI